MHLCVACTAFFVGLALIIFFVIFDFSEGIDGNNLRETISWDPLASGLSFMISGGAMVCGLLVRACTCSSFARKCCTCCG